MMTKKNSIITQLTKTKKNSFGGITKLISFSKMNINKKKWVDMGLDWIDLVIFMWVDIVVRENWLVLSCIADRKGM